MASAEPQEQTARVATSHFRDAQQQLIVDTAVAYFNVLRALDTLSFVQAQKEAVYRQLDQRPLSVSMSVW